MVLAAIKRSVLFFVFASLLNGAVSSTAQWELRTTGADNNGGFFVPGGGGTDFSQQNAAQYTFADLASANGTTNPCTVTSASHNFVAADVGNGMHISAGTNWTTGWYQIVSVAANAATLDRACGSAAALSGGTFFVGGGLLTVGGAGTATTSAAGGGAANNVGTVNIRAGTYTLTSTAILGASGLWQGYQTTHGDNGTPPTITTATNSTDLIHLTGANASTIFDNIVFTTTAGTPAIGILEVTANAAYVGIRESSFSGFTNAINCDNIGAHFECAKLDLNGVEIKNSTSDGLTTTGTGTVSCVACWIHNSTGDGIKASNSGGNMDVFISNSILSANGGKGIEQVGSTAGVKFICSFSDIANNTGDGVLISFAIDSTSCIYYGNGGWGINAPTGATQITPFSVNQNNAFGANTSGARNNVNAGLNEITLTANPFTSATNFALNSTAGGGAALKTLGFPGTFPGGLTVSTSNIGATQSSSAGTCTAFCKLR